MFPTNPQNLTSVQNIVIIASLNTTKRSATQLRNSLNGSTSPDQANQIMSTYYSGNITTSGYPIITDNENPYDNYLASALGSLST